MVDEGEHEIGKTALNVLTKPSAKSGKRNGFEGTHPAPHTGISSYTTHVARCVVCLPLGCTYGPRFMGIYVVTIDATTGISTRLGLIDGQQSSTNRPEQQPWRKLQWICVDTIDVSTRDEAKHNVSEAKLAQSLRPRPARVAPPARALRLIC